jgi:predicted transposase YbfD/YdcC
MCAVLCGLDELEEIVTFGKGKKEFLNKHFGITKVPSEATLSRIMNMVNGDIVAGLVINIMREMIGISGDIIAIDGKTICSTAKKGSSREKLHIVTAYLTNNGVTLGQLPVNEKTNEIPVLRDLLDMIDIEGKIITADAMHCQKDTVEKIIDGGGDYVLGLKENQKILHDEIKTYIDDCVSDKTIEVETAQTTEKNKDRFEQRTCYKAPNLEWLESKDEWKGLRGAFAVHRKIIGKNQTSEETSYYITSLNVPAQRLLEIVREHWKIESMHWQLDVVFSEDDCRILNSNGQKTLNIFRKFSLALHKKDVSGISKKTKPSLKNNMFRALLSDDRLLEIISVTV